MFCSINIRKVVCSNFGELSNAQYSLHGIWCMMFNMNFDGARGGGLSFPPSPNGKEQQGPQSPSGLGETSIWFQELLDTCSSFPPVYFLLGRSPSSSLCHLRNSSPTAGPSKLVGLGRGSLPQQRALLSLVRCSALNPSMHDPQGDARSCLLLCLLLQTKLQPWWVCGSKA